MKKEKYKLPEHYFCINDMTPAFEVDNPYKDKLKKVLEICKINAKGRDADQHDGKAEFKTICDLIEDKGWYEK